MARQRAARELSDFGPVEGLRSGRVVIEGQAAPRGRALSIADDLPPELLNSLALLLRLFEGASLPGYARSDMERAAGGGRGVCKRDEPTERAEAARRHLAAIEQHVGALAWSVIIDVLLWGRSAQQWAFDCRSRGFAVDRNAARPVLLAALSAISGMCPPKRPQAMRAEHGRKSP